MHASSGSKEPCEDLVLRAQQVVAEARQAIARTDRAIACLMATADLDPVALRSGALRGDDAGTSRKAVLPRGPSVMPPRPLAGRNSARCGSTEERQVPTSPARGLRRMASIPSAPMTTLIER